MTVVFSSNVVNAVSLLWLNYVPLNYVEYISIPQNVTVCEDRWLG